MVSATKVSRRLALALAVLPFVAIGGPTAKAADPVTLKFGTFVGPTSFLNVGIFEPWFEQIESDADGAVEIEFLSGGSAAKPNEVFDAVRAGIVDIGWSSPAYNPGRFHASGVSELPGLANGPAEGSVAMADLYDLGLLDGYDDVKVLGVATTDVARLHHSGDVSGLDDFKGAKVRAAGQVLSGMIEKTGATPVGVPITSVAESLAKNVIDGSAADWFSLEGFRLVDVTKTHVDLALGAPAIYLIMNKQKYEQLPDNVKAAFDKHSVRDFAEFWGSRLEAKSQGVRDEVAKMDGHKIIVPSEEELATWNAAADEVIAAWAEATPNGQAVLDAYREGVESYRAAQ